MANAVYLSGGLVPVDAGTTPAANCFYISAGMSGDDTGATVSPTDALHSHSAEAPTVQAGMIYPETVSQAHATDTVTVIQTHVLAVGETAHGHSAEQPGLGVGTVVQPSIADHVHATDSPVLAQEHILSPADGILDHATDAAAMYQTHVLAAGSTAHGHSLDETIATELQIVAPSETLHSQAVDQPSVYVVAKSAAMEWVHEDIPPASSWTLEETEPRRAIYVAVLRADGYDDLEVPMSSMQLRRRNGYPTMVSIVVPDVMTYLEGAQDRVGGEIIIYAGSATEDGTQHLSELERAMLETVSYDHGVNSSSLSLSGYRTVETGNPRPVDLTGITYYGLQADGKRRVRGSVNIFLRPGDTAIYGANEMVVDQIYMKVEASNSWMEVAGT